MTNEERDLISRFVARVGGSPQQGFGTPPSGSQLPALPPVDAEADRFINDQFAQHPEARYRVTQMAFVQEAALAEAQNRIRRLEWELQQARSQQQQDPNQGQQQGAPQQSRGFFGNLFGGGQQGQNPGGYGAQPQGYGRPPGYGQQQQFQAPPQPQYPPGYQPGMLQQQAGRGSGFLGSALTTAAGVAGGMVAGNALMGLFSGHEGGGFGGGHETVNETINNYGTDPNAGAAGGADPWAGAGTSDPNAGYPQDQGAVDQGSGFDQGGVDPGTFDQGGGDSGGGWGDFGGGGGGGDDPFS
ncbi:MAG: DUF2076 domain-containing protein [Janthinobacterium lividum]